MSTSTFVCWRDGLPVTTHRGAWRHALGGRTGAIPRSKKHKPVPIARAEFTRAFAWDTPLGVARLIAERMRAEDSRINGTKGGSDAEQL